MTIPKIKESVFHVETRREAIEALANGADIALHDHSISPLIHRAASELIMRDDAGQKTDIKAVGLPHVVLSEVAEALQNMGVSMFASSQILEALENYAVGLGADFAREAQAKPLYARIVVTDKKPDDLPECALTQSTLIDGERSVGDTVSQRVMQSTIYGTRTSMTKEMSLDAMLSASKKKWLLIYYGSPSTESFKGLDSVDVSLINLTQGLGGKIPDTVLEELQDAVQRRQTTPLQEEIIDDFATLKTLVETYPVGEPLPAEIRVDLSRRVADISDKILAIHDGFSEPFEQALTEIASVYDIPVVQHFSVLTEAVNDDFFIPRLEAISLREDVPTPLQNRLQEVLADFKETNAPQALDSVTETLLEIAAQEGVSLSLFQEVSSVMPDVLRAKNAESPRIVDISRPPSNVVPADIESFVALVEILSESIKTEIKEGRPLPPLMADLLKRIETVEKTQGGQSKEATIALWAKAICDPSEVAFSQDVQTLVLTLARPDIQVVLQTLPTLAQSTSLRTFSVDAPRLIETAVTATLIRGIEAQQNKTESKVTPSSVITLPSFEPSELKQMLEVLKSEGVTGLVKASLTNTSAVVSPALNLKIDALIKQNPSLIEPIVFSSIVRAIETQIERPSPTSTPLIKLEPAELKQVINVLKQEGMAVLTKPDILSKLTPATAEIVTTTAVIREIESRLQGLPVRSSSGVPGQVTTPELKQMLEIIKKDGVAELLKPETIRHLPPTVQDTVTSLIKRNPTLMEAVTTAQIIRDIEARIERPSQQISQNQSIATTRLLTLEPAELKQVLHVLKQDGIGALTKPEILSRLTPATAEIVTTTAIIREIESRLQGLPVRSSSLLPAQVTAPELKQMLEIIKKDGVAELLKPETIRHLPQAVQDTVTSLIKRKPTLMEAVTTAQVIRDIEARIERPSQQISQNQSIATTRLLTLEPAELKQVLHVLKQDGITAFSKPEKWAHLPPVTQQLIRTVAEASVIERESLSPPIRRLKEEFVRDRAPAQLMPAHETASILSRVMTQLTPHITAQDYARNLQSLDKVIQTLTATPAQNLKETVATLLGEPAGQTHIKALAESLRHYPVETLSPADKPTMMTVMLTVAEARLTHQIETSPRIPEPVRAELITTLQTAIATKNPEQIQLALDKVEQKAVHAGIPLPDAIEDLKQIVEQKVEIHTPERVDDFLTHPSEEPPKPERPMPWRLAGEDAVPVSPESIIEEKKPFELPIEDVIVDQTQPPSPAVPPPPAGGAVECESMKNGGPCCGCCSPKFKEAAALDVLLRDAKKAALEEYDTLMGKVRNLFGGNKKETSQSTVSSEEIESSYTNYEITN